MSKIKVSMDKKYKTVSGQPVTILGVDMPLEGGFSVVGLVHSSDGTGTPETWSAYGAYFTKVSSGRDLVECKPYEDFKMDEPVMFSTNGTNWHPRHFAGINSDGNATFWAEGATSWSAESVDKGQVAVDWKFIRKPTPEELKNA